jgi:hypothetical protein
MKDNLSEQEFAIIPTVVSGNQEMVIIDFLKIAIELLRQARTLEDTQDVWQKVNALEALSKKFRLSKDVQLDATELRIRIERRLGEILSQKKSKRRRSLKKQNQNSVKVDLDSETSKSIRSNLNFTKNDLSNSRNLPALHKNL